MIRHWKDPELTYNLACLAQFSKQGLLASQLDPSAFERSLVVTAKQRLVLVEIEKPSLAVIRAIICVAALSRWFSAGCRGRSKRPC
jgi:hypothetical protein